MKLKIIYDDKEVSTIISISRSISKHNKLKRKSKTMVQCSKKNIRSHQLDREL